MNRIRRVQRNIKKSGPRINNNITSDQVRVISAQGEQIGIITIDEALKLARDAGLDLVEIAENSKPPVCKIIDYGKYKYQQSKRTQEAKKKQAVVVLKEIVLTPGIDEHDLNTKVAKINKWLKNKWRVKISIRFKGREFLHHELGYKALDKLFDKIDQDFEKDSNPKMEGRRLVVVIKAS